MGKKELGQVGYDCLWCVKKNHQLKLVVWFRKTEKHHIIFKLMEEDSICYQNKKVNHNHARH